MTRLFCIIVAAAVTVAPTPSFASGPTVGEGSLTQSGVDDAPLVDRRTVDQIRRRRGVAMGGLITMGAGFGMAVGGLVVAIGSDDWDGYSGGTAIVGLGAAIMIIGEVIAAGGGSAASLHPEVGGPVPVPAILCLGGLGLSITGIALAFSDSTSALPSAVFWTGVLATGVGSGLAIGDSSRALRRLRTSAQLSFAPLVTHESQGAIIGLTW